MVAELLMQMLKSCKRQTPPPRLRVALQIAAETLEDIQEAGHNFAEAVLREVQAGRPELVGTFLMTCSLVFPL